jgi:predicted  nucleic acid-binding Zn-ribbon protein
MPEDDKGGERDENAISPEDFEKLEDREQKKKLFGFMKRKKDGPLAKPEKEPEKIAETGGGGSLDRVVLKMEKIEGKLESLEEVRKVTDERFSRLSEEIGELRSSILEKDRAFDRVEAGSKRVEEIVEELEPARMRRDLEKKSEGILKNQARIEAISTQIKEMSKSIKDLRDIMGRIKDIGNLVNVSNEMGKMLSKIQEERRTVSKTSGKIEAIFSEMSKKISEFDSYKDKVDFNAETMHDLMKSLDMLEVKLEGVFKKEDMKKMDESISKVETECKDRIQDIKDIVNMLVSSLKKTNLKEVLDKQGIESVHGMNERISELQGRVKAMEGMKKSIEGLQNDIDAVRRGMDYVKTSVEHVRKEGEQAMAVEQKKEEEQKTDALSEMVKYVRDCFDSGYTTRQIKSELLEKGWSRRTVNEVILREVIRRRKGFRVGKGAEKRREELKGMVVSPAP